MEDMVVTTRLGLPDANFWKGKRVLLTGHTGFKGAWLVIWLRKMGAHVFGLSLAPNTTPNLFDLAVIDSICSSFFCDIRDQTKIAKMIDQISPDIVFHLAAQSLVREGYKSPIKTFSTNVMGTAHLLSGLLNVSSVRVAVMVTTDKVYKNNEWDWPYREGDALGGHDPYSASKAASEILIDSYRSSFFENSGVALSSARAGNVIGGGDWSTDRLIPDAVRAWQQGDILNIRRPDATRPWQHVLDPLSGYLKLAERTWECPELAGAYNFGPDSSGSSSVKKVIELARHEYGSGRVYFEAKSEGPHEAELLTLEVAKARNQLQVNPVWALSESVSRTMRWYVEQFDGLDARSLCEADIESFEASGCNI
jgi:CDP-glucose 4,6-dehydratase|tara:strand:+ start:684 stop:1781 length:1098 start_codon:yes stop_codon:yes gene_type:complete